MNDIIQDNAQEIVTSRGNIGEDDSSEDSAGESIEDESVFSAKSHSISSKSSLSGSTTNILTEERSKGSHESTYIGNKCLVGKGIASNSHGDEILTKENNRKNAVIRNPMTILSAKNAKTGHFKTSKPHTSRPGADNPDAYRPGNSATSTNTASTRHASRSTSTSDRGTSHWSRHDREDSETALSMTPQTYRYHGDATYGDVEVCEDAQQHNGFRTNSSDPAVIRALGKVQYRFLRARGRAKQDNSGIVYTGVAGRLFQ